MGMFIRIRFCTLILWGSLGVKWGMGQLVIIQVRQVVQFRLDLEVDSSTGQLELMLRQV